jgi:hypothetical protein
MSAGKPPVDRLSNPSDGLQRAIQRAERGLSSPSAEGFREALKRVREAVLNSERLVAVLEQLLRYGLRRRQSHDSVSPPEVEAAIRAVGSLANTTPLKLSDDYKRYTDHVKALTAVGRSVLERGLKPSVDRRELDEWKLFREPGSHRPPPYRVGSGRGELKASPGMRHG